MTSPGFTLSGLFASPMGPIPKKPIKSGHGLFFERPKPLSKTAIRQAPPENDQFIRASESKRAALALKAVEGDSHDPFYLAGLRDELKAGNYMDSHRDAYGFTPLHRAAMNHHLKTLRLLIDAGGNVNTRNENGETPLHSVFYLGSSQSQSDMVRLLLAAGANPNLKDARLHSTPLHWAALVQNSNAATLLRNAGAKLDIKNRDGHTPQDWMPAL